MAAVNLLVSLLTPTFNRREFFLDSIHCFQEQDYPNLEWIILDDGTDPIYDLLPSDSRIRYFYETRRNHGEKMNRCFELSQGSIGIVWDDDDIYSGDRVTRQVQPLIDNSELQITGTSSLYYTDGQRTRLYQSENWLASIAIRKTIWQQHKFDPILSGADYIFQKKISSNAKLDLNDPNLVTARIHPDNACPKRIF